MLVATHDHGTAIRVLREAENLARLNAAEKRGRVRGDGSAWLAGESPIDGDYTLS